MVKNTGIPPTAALLSYFELGSTLTLSVSLQKIRLQKGNHIKHLRENFSMCCFTTTKSNLQETKYMNTITAGTPSQKRYGDAKVQSHMPASMATKAIKLKNIMYGLNVRR